MLEISSKMNSGQLQCLPLVPIRKTEQVPALSTPQPWMTQHGGEGAGGRRTWGRGVPPWPWLRQTTDHQWAEPVMHVCSVQFHDLFREAFVFSVIYALHPKFPTTSSFIQNPLLWTVSTELMSPLGPGSPKQAWTWGGAYGRAEGARLGERELSWNSDLVTEIWGDFRLL